MPIVKVSETWRLGTKLRSLSSPSDNTFIGIQVRGVEAGKLRWQVGTEEGHFSVSDGLWQYTEKLPHPHKSTQSDKMYAEARARLGETLGTVRIQMSGPAINRPWGVVFAVSAPDLAAVVASLLGVSYTGPPAEDQTDGDMLDAPGSMAPGQESAHGVHLVKWKCALGTACVSVKSGVTLSLCKPCLITVQQGSGQKFVCHADCKGGECTAEAFPVAPEG